MIFFAGFLTTGFLNFSPFSGGTFFVLESFLIYSQDQGNPNSEVDR